MRQFARLSALALCALFCISAAFAGDVGGRLRCVVTDPTKATIDKAQLSLKDINNTFSASGTTNEAGEYVFINVPPGTYRLVADKDGFSQETVENVVIDLNEVKLLNISMHLNGVTEVVEIHAQRVSIVPEQSFLRGLVDPQRMKELPLNGRNFSDLIFTQPGVARDFTGIFGDNHSVDGARDTMNDFLIDGGEANDNFVPIAASLNINTSGIPLDAIDEFSVITSNATAEYGRSSGGTVNIVTKSGTEKLHGSAWEFLRNDVFDSRNYFDNPGVKEPFRQNQFGAHLGGAFNSVFFSGAYEGFRQRQLVTVESIVPLPSFIATVVNPAWKSILQYGFPAANGPAVSPISGINDSNFNNARNQDSYFLRLDRSFGQSHRDFVTLSTVKGDTVFAGQSNSQRNWYGVFTDNWMMTPSLYNTFRFSVNRIASSSVSPSLADSVLQAGTGRFAGPFAGLPFTNELSSANGFPSISTTTGVFSSIGPSVIYPDSRGETAFNLQNSTAWIRGRHQFTIGADLRRIQINDNNESAVRPVDVIDSSTLANLQAGIVLAQVQSYYVYNNTGMRGIRDWEMDFFVQDSYRLFSRFLLDYGLRYEFNPPTHEVHNIFSNAFVMQNGRPQSCQSLPYGAGMSQVALILPSQFGIDPYCADWNNLAPRVGFAWDLFGDNKTVLRGSYGIFYDHIYGAVLNQFRYNVPFVVPTRIGFFAYDGRQASPVVDTTSAFRASTVDPGLRTPYTQRWHLTVSREISRDVLLNVSYVGASGNDLTTNERPNFGDNFADAFRPSNGISPALMPRNPADISNNVIAGPWGAFSNLTTDGYSWYHALQAELLKRYSSGLTLQASYTWAHSLDTISADLASSVDSITPAATLNNMLAPLFAPGSSCPTAVGTVFSPLNMRNAVRCATGNNTLTTDQAAAIFVNQYTSRATPDSNYGDSAFDVRHRFTANAIYELPFGRNKKFLNGASRLADKFVGGWQVATIIEAQTGTPLPILAGTDANFDGDRNDRAIATGDLSTLYFSGGAVTPDATGAARQYQCAVRVGGVCTSPVGQGLGIIDPRLRLGRGAFRTPGLFNMDGSIAKRIALNESYSLQFRSEFFNLLNRVNFAAPLQQINNPLFGTSTSQLLINNTQSRQVQFGLKLEF